MNCAQCDHYLLDFVLSFEPVPADVLEHVVSCGSCMEKANALRRGASFADELEMEEPALTLDAPILAAARARVDKQAIESQRSRSSKWPQLAAAATALLAVGVGFWSTNNPWLPVSQTQRAATTSSQQTLPRSAADTEAAAPQEPSLELAEAEAPTALGEPAQSPAEPPAVSRTEPAGAKKKTRSDRGIARPRVAKEGAVSVRKRRKMARQSAEVMHDEGDEVADGSGEAFGAVAKSTAAGSERASHPATEGRHEQSNDSYRARCRNAVPEYERFLAKAQPDDEGIPKVTLELGRCYRTLGDGRRARDMLRRAASYADTRKAAKRELDTIGTATKR